MPNKNLTDQIASVEREIAMRRHVYPRWVESGRYTRQKADHEIACMVAVLETLQAVDALFSSQYGITEIYAPKHRLDRLMSAVGTRQGKLL